MAKKVAAGWAHTVLLLDDGTPVAFGDERAGQCAAPGGGGFVDC